MKTPLLLLIAAAAAFAQPESGQCGSSKSVATLPAPAGTGAVLAAKPARAAGVALQIRDRQNNRLSPSSCRCGTVLATALAAQATSQEVVILSGLTGKFRFDHILLQETEQFTTGGIGTLTVGVGRPSLGTEMVAPFPLKSDSAPDNSWYQRPSPPQLTGSYDVALKFQSSLPLGDGAASSFRSGAVAWEVCGYSSR